MKTKIIIILLLTVLIGLAPDVSGVTKVGTTSANFLKIGVSARAIGMGGAFVALANDASAMYWNPAGLAEVNGAEAFFNHSEWIADIKFDYAGLVANLPQIGAFGLNATFLNMADMERTTAYYPEGTGQKFNAGSYALAFTYARSLTDRFSIGTNIKYIHEYILNSSASGFAIDIGTLFITRFRGLRIGANITNFGTKMQMDGRDVLVQHDIDPLREGNNDKVNADLSTDRFDLPLYLRVGIAYDLLQAAGGNNLWLAIDASHPNDNVETLNIGSEFIFRKLLSLRAGYASVGADDSEKGLTFGAGMMYTLLGSVSARIDYAYESFGRFDNVQKFSVAIGF
ncbi:PorV/PorQ family protein [candidate division KSB1 bacterium]|nr:PorV/PorQ family protein [candidate division KSB1 bacterium]